MTSLGDMHYFLSFIDDFFRCCRVYTMRHKEKVINLFAEWKKHIEKHIERKIKVLHSDNGDEYTSDPFL